MTRRYFIAASVALTASAQPVSPRNRVANEGNAFSAGYAEWARSFNGMKPGSISVEEQRWWEPLADLWRRVVRARREWIG